MRRHYVIYSKISGQPVTARFTRRAAQRYCGQPLSMCWYRYER